MIYRYIDPGKIDVKADCLEMSELFSGERVEGKEIRVVELAEVGEGDGIEVVGELEDVMGIHVLVSGISDDAASAIESLFGEVINRMKGVSYSFRKERALIKISKEAEEKFSAECVAKVIYEAVKSIPAVKSVKVRIVCEREEFEKLRRRAEEIHRRREERLRELKEIDVDKFYGCKSCQVYLPNHVCVITPERASPCGTTYAEAKNAEELKVVEYYFPIKRGDVISEKEGEFSGVNKAVKEITEGKVEKVKLHRVLESPPLAGNFAEAIVFYIPEKDAFGIVDREYKKKTPVGLTFEEMEKLIAGRQVEGFVGVSFAYLKSPSFLKGEGGWKRVVWVSPKIYEFVRSFLPKELLEGIESG